MSILSVLQNAFFFKKMIIHFIDGKTSPVIVFLLKLLEAAANHTAESSLFALR